MDVGTKKEMTMNKIKFIVLLLVTSMICACSVTKNLPEGEVLYVGQKPMQIQGDDSLSNVGVVALEEVKAALREETPQHTTILIKGSNGTKLYQLRETLRELLEKDEPLQQ